MKFRSQMYLILGFIMALSCLIVSSIPMAKAKPWPDFDPPGITVDEFDDRRTPKKPPPGGKKEKPPKGKW